MLEAKEFGMRVLEARTAQGISQIDLTKIALISELTVIHVEKGKVLPTLVNAIAIAEALHVDLEWLCGLQDVMRRADSMEAIVEE